MGANNTPSNKIGDGTLRPPTNPDETSQNLDSSVNDRAPNAAPAPTVYPASKPPADDPLATAVFDSTHESNKQIFFESDRPSNIKPVPDPKPKPKIDKFQTINEVVVRIPGFKIRNELGRGAFGVVYKAYDEMLDRDVAIKVPILDDPALQKQYIDEARKAVKLEHPGIVQTYHVGIAENGQPFVVQKLIEGTTLRSLMKERGGALSLGEALGILRPVCLALESAHSIGMIHRDLKPENLLLDKSGRPFVADFGLAVSDEEDLSGRTEVAGTPLYMSPEQFSGRTQWLDGRSDIWAIGVIFYEVLVGKSPFYAESMRELKEQIFEKDPRPIHQRQPNIPATFDAIFRKCCAKQTSNRFGSVRELIEAIDNAIEELPEQGILELMPELQKGSQSKRSSSQHLSSSGLPRGKRLSSTNLSSWDPQVTTSGRIARAWNVFGPLLAIACTVGAMGWMYFTTLKNADRQQIVVATPPATPIGNDAITNPQSIAKPSLPENPIVSPNGNTSIPPADNISATSPAKIEPSLATTGVASGNAISPPMQSPPQSANTLQTNSTPPNSTLPNSTLPNSILPNSIQPNSMPPKPSAPAVPQKPYRVSLRTGDGTHDSLAAAIADSAPGDTVYVMEGTYREPLLVDKNLKIVGEGEKHNVILQTEGISCLTIRNNATVHLENLKLKTNRAESGQANTIDVESGELLLEKCFVVSNSFDCVKLREGTQLKAMKSDFQSSEHATVRAEKGSEMEIDGCDFLLHPDSDDSMKKVCIQAEGATGKIKNSRFKGPCMAGIEWRDQQNGQLLIEKCSFAEIRLAISLTSCTDVVMRGDKQSPLALKNCDDSIWIRDSKVSIEGAQITGNRTDLKKGIAAQKNSQVSLKGSLISGFQTGLAADNSKILVEDTAFRDSTERSVRAISSDITLEDVELVGGGPNGLHSSGESSLLTINAGLISNTTSGLWVESGKVSLNQVIIRDCTVGFIAGINADMAKLFSDNRTDESNANDKNTDSEASLLSMTGTGITFSSCEKGVVFMSPGDLSFANVRDDFMTDSKKRLSTRASDLIGVGDYAKFEAKWRSIRDREAK